MSKLYIQLGRTGDILNILPLLHQDFLKSGEKSRLMVAAEYASVLDGVSYIEPVIFQGPHYDIARAVDQAKELGGEYVVTQINGPQSDVAENTYQPAGQPGAVTTSFQKESWRIAGRLGEWDDCPPLVFDRRDKKREEKLLRKLNLLNRGKKLPIILLSLDGSSSPFPHSDLLRELVKSRYGSTHRIIELPKAERIYDLLAIYERAQCLIATDSAPLHLAWACRKLPVFALTQDKPLLWHGASWRPTFAFYCRYGDFPNRCVDMLRIISNPIQESAPPKTITVWQEYDQP